MDRGWAQEDQMAEIVKGRAGEIALPHHEGVPITPIIIVSERKGEAHAFIPTHRPRCQLIPGNGYLQLIAAGRDLRRV